MFELDAFVIRGPEKVIDHYHWLQHYARCEMEHQRLRDRMERSEVLHLHIRATSCLKSTAT